jgi:photosystem II stability/assembly factor-like uncharacterized protein
MVYSGFCFLTNFDEAGMFSKQLHITILCSAVWLLTPAQSNLCAQGWQWQNPLPQGDNLNLVFFADRQHGWITSDGPILLRTRNSGTNWEILRTGIVFTDIHFINPLEGWGIGNARFDVIRWYIYHTTDGGTTWEVQLADTTARYDIFFLDAKHGWATNNWVGPDELLFTADGGKTWERQAQGQFRDNDEVFSVMFLDLLKGWVVGYTGGRGGIRTKDGGKTWQRDSTLVSAEQLFFADSSYGWARHTSRWIYRTSDGGERWERVEVTDVTGEIRSNHFFALDTHRCFVALNVGLFISIDGGKGWTLHSPQALTSFAFLDSTEAWGVLGDGLYHSLDGGRSWQNLTKNILPEGVIYFSCLDFITAQTGWVAGRTQRNDGVILNTRDGGMTWTEQWRDNGKRIEQIFFIDERFGWGVGFDGYIVHTNNSGQTWRIQNSGTDFILRAVTFVDTERGWVVGGSFVNSGVAGIILHTKDRGQTWINQTPMQTPRLWDVAFVDALNGWVVGGGGSGVDSGTILRTRDGGRTWSPLRQGEGLDLEVVAFTDTLHGWAAGYDPLTEAVIIHTEDGGVTWSPQLVGPYYIPTDMRFVDSLHGWAVSLLGRIFYTSDGGRIWQEQQVYTSRSLEAIDFVDARTGWIVGWYGTILHTKSGGLNNVNYRPSILSQPKRFVLYDNYPDPFNTQTKIRFEIFTSRAKVRLQIYDLHGHVIAKLIDETQTGGLHEAHWDGTEDKGAACASGLYLYRLEVDGIVQVGKAVLLK